MRKTIAALTGAATTALVLSGAGLAAASARPATSGTETFHLMTTSSTSNTYSIIATGVFTAGGTDVSHNGYDVATLSNGSFRINHPGRGKGKESLNPKTCLFTGNLTARYTLSNGTGAYAGISGSGTAHLSILAVAARNSAGKCSETLKPVAWQETITASGPVRL
jgi:hypothetical protein